ncbi:Gfo/Idh/MocA family oxidoreductase [Tissierella sp.]|uniref:Gfo/Idh/MocA family protein n=1 Tax=Tissierella sp. TaxID=41274 RepID=UPI00285CCF52|nr:Gfo/Idh/MocA family oxidoreductase [Tissierella sp.]MDR7857536.1 Gfo/Idh/MocA family oxidoreductase [Tissierella sp.]
MKILVVGLGSMGKRRINLLTKNFSDDCSIVGVDSREDRRIEVEKTYNIKTYLSLDEAISIEKPNCALICTSPITHSDIIIRCLEDNLNVFTEINLLTDRYQEIIDLANKNNLKLFLSSTFMYRKEIQYIQNEISSSNDKYHYRYHVGQYLPDWHPWENYKDFFVGDKRTNGCRELLAIELPWIINTFGKIIKFNVIRDNISSLQLDYPDSYIISCEHENGHKGVLSVDVVSRRATRNLEIYSENNHIFWEGNPESLKRYSVEDKKIVDIDTYSKYIRDMRYADSIIEDAYLDELIIFIDMVKDKDPYVRYTFEDDMYTLNLIDKIEGV